MKQCSKCGQIKSLDEYHFVNKAKGKTRPDCKSCRNAQMREYHFDHIEEQHRRNREWRAINLEQHKANSREYYHANKAQVATRRLAWQRANKDKTKASRLKWELANPESSIRRRISRRAAKRNAFVGQITKKEIGRLYASRCFYCGSNQKITLDHVIPISRGGSHSIGNLVPACQFCNFSKHDKLLMEWRVWQSRNNTKRKING
jgi:5-methylcytosine-specific restriction endonuclease McrA